MKSKLYGIVDFSNKNPVVTKNPMILPAAYKLNGKQVSGFLNCKNNILKCLCFVEYDNVFEPEKPSYDDKTQMIVQSFEYKNGKIKKKYIVQEKDSELTDTEKSISNLM